MDKFYETYSMICDCLDDAIEDLGQKKAVKALVEAIANADWDDYDRVVAQLKNSL